mgnify:CR=1 FL=1
MPKCDKCNRRYNMFDYHNCFSEFENIQRMSKDYQEKQQSKEGIANYDINQVVTIDKDLLHHILRDEMMNNLLTVLGINDFNKWYVETVGGPAPFINVGHKKRKVYDIRKYKYQKYHILEDEIDNVNNIVNKLNKEGY